MIALSLKWKAIAAISSLVIILMLVMSFLTFNYFESRFKASISEQQLTMISAMAKEIDHKLQTAHEALIAEAIHAPADLAENPDKAQAFLDKMVGMQTIFDNKIFVFSAAGKLVAETPYETNRRGLDFFFRDYIKKTLATKKPVIGDPYISSQAHRHPAIMCTAPVFDRNGNLVYILAGGIDLMKENFLGELSTTRVGKTGYIYLYNTDRTIIIHPDRNRILQQDVPVGSNYLFDRAIEGFEGTEETVNSRGIEALSTFKRVPSTNWILVANHPTAEAYASIIEGKKYFFMATTIAIIIVLIIIWLLVKYLTSQLITFTRHVEGMSVKEGEARFSQINTGDEIGALSRAFNQMVAELDKKNESLLKSEELYRTVVDFASDLAFWRSPQGILLYISPNAERITGYRDTEFYADATLIDIIIHPDDQKLWRDIPGPNAIHSSMVTREFRIITKTGDTRWISHVRRYIFSDTGAFLGVRGSHSDITDRKLAEDKLLYLSLHDTLTGVYNRAFFEAEMRRLAVSEFSSGVIVCDVDGLKLINDTLGHDHGDKLLVNAAETIKLALHPTALFARVGGDEFVILMPGAEAAEVENTIMRIRQQIARHNAANPHLLLSISLGMATGIPAKDNIVTLFKQADDNMYREKLQHSQSTRSAIVQALMQALEARDFGTEGHADRLQELMAKLAALLHLPDNRVTDLCLLGQFHDIGKVGIPDQILFKPGPLTREERTIMQRHPEIGHRIAQSAPDLVPIADWILKHHEWWNGEGYPLGLRGEQIPLECRILAITDAYDAMTSDRPYRKAMPHQAAALELQRCAGTQFDPYLVEQFIQLFEHAHTETDHQTA